MRKLIIFSALALLMPSCIIYTDKDDKENPQEETLAILHDGAVNSVIQSIKISDFFDRYQDIREDRDAALKLGYEYYGDRLNEEFLFYERYSGGFSGNIEAAAVEGQYTVTPLLRDLYYSDIKYHVEAAEGRRYNITTRPPETKAVSPDVYVRDTELTIELDCSAYVSEEDGIVIEKLEMRHIERIGKQTVTVHISLGSETVRAKLAEESTYTKIPSSGVLNYEIESNMFNDQYSVRYTDGNHEIL